MSTPPHPKVIGVLGLGQMGSGVAADLRNSGFDVVASLEGRSPRTGDRAANAGVHIVSGIAEVVTAADTFLSIVPADQALPLAERVAAALGGRPLHYVDCNSITPSKSAAIAAIVTGAGATFSDGGIIGPPPGGRTKTRLYVSGPHSEVLAALATASMPVIPLGPGLTQATEMKVLFAAANKGATALLANVLAAAKLAGLLDRVTGELDAIRPGLLGCVRGSAPDLADKAARWAVEMDDLAEGLREMGAHGGYHDAAADGYRRLAANIADTGDEPEALARVLTAWVGPKNG